MVSNRFNRRPHRAAATVILQLGWMVAIFARSQATPTRLWSRGTTHPSESVVGVTLGSGGLQHLLVRILTLRRSPVFSATRSIVFAGDKGVVAMKIELPPFPQSYKSFSRSIQKPESSRTHANLITSDSAQSLQRTTTMQYSPAEASCD